MTAAVAAVGLPEGVESFLTADEAAFICNVRPVTVRQWATRGYGTPKVKLPIAGIDRLGRKVYRLLDVARAENATRSRARRT